MIELALSHNMQAQTYNSVTSNNPAGGGGGIHPY